MQIRSTCLAAILAAGCLLASVSAAEAGPLVAAIGAAATAIGGALSSAFAATGLTGFLIKTALSVGLSLISSLLTPRPKQKGGFEGEIQVGGDVPRSIPFGEVMTAGHLVFWNTSGPDNAILHLVYTLADWECEGITRVIVDGEERAIEAMTPDANASAKWRVPFYNDSDTPAGDPRMTIWFHRGRWGDAANTNLVAASNPSGRWDANSRLNGCCYVVVRLRYNKEKFKAGRPDILFQLKGAKLYDPRKDSTVGGSGAHRWADPTTWEWSENPVIAEYNYRRGFYRAGQRILGIGHGSYDLLLDRYISEANVCDETVNWTEDGVAKSEKRYRVAYVADDDMQHGDTVQGILDAAAGTIIERAGLFMPYVGVARTPILTIEEGDLIAGSSVTWSSRASRDKTVNSVFGQYTSLADLGQAQSYAPLIVPTWEAEDGERLALQFDLPQVTSKRQAEYIARIKAEEARASANGSITVGLPFWAVEAGDWFNFTNRVGGTRTYRAESVTSAADGTTRIEFKAILASVYDDALTVVPRSLVDPPAVGSQVTTLSGFDLQAVDVTGSNSQVLPGLKFVWTPITDQTVTFVILELRRQGETDAKTIAVPDPSAGQFVVQEGVLAATVYEGRGTIRTEPARATTWTDWESVTSGSNYAIPVDVAIEDDSITGAMIQALSIDASKIAADAVTAGKIAANAVTDQKIQADAVTQAKIAAAAVTAAKIAALAVDASKIGAAAVEEGKIAANAVVASKIATSAVGVSQIASAAVEETKLATGAVTAAKVAANAVVAGKIAAGAVTTETIAANAITANKIGAGQVVADAIAAGAIQAGKIAANAVVAASIAAGAITANAIGANAVGANAIAANAITARHMVIADFSNLLVDADLRDGATWSFDGSGAEWSFDNGTSATNDKRFIHCFNPTGVGADGAMAINSRPSVCEPGKIYACSGILRSTTAFQGTWILYMQFLRADLTVITEANIGQIASIGEFTVPAAAQAAAPTDGAYVRLRLRRGGIPGSIPAQGACYAWDLTIRRAQSAELIVDGAIIASKIQANAVVAEKIAAGAIQANHIAANAIQAVHIAAGAIVAEKIGANAIGANAIAARTIFAEKIVLNGISTDVVADSAISDIYVVGASADLGIPTTDTDLFNLNVVTTGRPVSIDVFVQIGFSSSAITAVTFKLRRGGSTIQVWETDEVEVKNRMFKTLQLLDTPPAGTHNYQITAAVTASGGGCVVRNRNLRIIVLKK